MSKKLVLKPRWIALALASGLAWSGWANAAALGEIKVLSARGQPLTAEIELILANAAEREGLSVSMSSPEEYWGGSEQAHSSRIAGLSSRIQTRPDGSAYILVSTPQPISSDVLSLMAELDSSSGKSVREYIFRFTTGDAPVAAPSAVSTEPVEHAEDATVLVKRGDNLNKIATANKPADVSLERMLVALYRANPQAFSGKNMNRLRAGKVLRLPSETELSGVTQREARHEIHAHVADWNAYRQKISGVASGYDTAYAQEGNGRIDSHASAEEAGDRMAPAQEVLKLSKGDAPGSRSSAAEVRTLKDKLQAAEEELTAREKTLRESRDRIAMLEKNNLEMQRLLELKSSAALAEKPVPAPESQAAGEIPASAPVAVSEVQPASELAAEKKPEAPAEAPVPEVKSSMPMYLAGAGLALLGVLGGVVLMRRKLKQSAKKPTPSKQTPVIEDTPPAAAPFEVPAEEVPEVIQTPVVAEVTLTAAEAEVALMSEISAADAGTAPVDIEIDMGEPVVKAEAAVLSEPLTPNEASVIDLSDERDHEAELAAARLAAEMEQAFAALDAVPETAAPEPAPDSVFELESMPPVAQSISSVSDKMDFDVPSFVPKAAESAATEAKATTESAPEVIAHADTSTKAGVVIAPAAATKPVGAGSAVEKPVAADKTAMAAADDDAPFDLDIPTIAQYTPALESAQVPPLPGVEDVDLNLVDDTNLTEEELQARGEHWLQVATKIDLARAYQEMGDFAGAREILEEVVNEGDGEQRATAETLLQQLPAL